MVIAFPLQTFTPMYIVLILANVKIEGVNSV